MYRSIVAVAGERAVAELRRRRNSLQIADRRRRRRVPAVREAVHELNAEGFIQILGRVPHDEIERYYSVVMAGLSAA